MKLKSNERCYIFPLGDLHVGHKNFNEDFFKLWENSFKNAGKNKRIYLLGDLLETPTTRVSGWDTAMDTNEALDKVVRMLKPYSDWIEFSVAGNHENRLIKEFNFNPAREIAERLNVPYSKNDFFDEFIINGEPYVVYGKHGTKTSRSSDLAMKGFKTDMADIKANLFLQGHNHYCEFSSRYQRDLVKGNRLYYAFTGHFLRYTDSYAHDYGYAVSPASFMRISVDGDGVTQAYKYYADELLRYDEEV